MNQQIIDEVTKVYCSDKYQYQDHYVPRVTEILSKMIHEDYLVRWSNQMGFQHRSYQQILKEASDYGTNTHETIEKYLKSTSDTNQYNTAVQAFILWWNQLIKNNKVEIMGQEQPIICSLYGGTYDLLLRINDLVYIVDFKTSNQVTYKYYLQLSAYKHILESEYHIPVDGGIIILQLSKTNPSYKEYVLNINNPSHKEYIEMCEHSFQVLAYAYYTIFYLETKFKENDYDKSSKNHSVFE